MVRMTVGITPLKSACDHLCTSRASLARNSLPLHHLKLGEGGPGAVPSHGGSAVAPSRRRARQCQSEYSVARGRVGGRVEEELQIELLLRISCFNVLHVGLLQIHSERTAYS